MNGIDNCCSCDGFAAVVYRYAATIVVGVHVDVDVESVGKRTSLRLFVDVDKSGGESTVDVSFR